MSQRSSYVIRAWLRWAGGKASKNIALPTEGRGCLQIARFTARQATEKKKEKIKSV